MNHEGLVYGCLCENEIIYVFNYLLFLDVRTTKIDKTVLIRMEKCVKEMIKNNVNNHKIY